MWLVIDHQFRPAAAHIRRGPSEADRLSARIGSQTQREQIGETEWSLDLEPVVRFQSDADRECCRGKALQSLSRAGERRIWLAELRLEPEMHARLVANLDHAPQRLVESGLHSADHRILGLVGDIGRVEIGEIVILDSVIEWTDRLDD
jgi:hypothetical protein